MAVPMANDPPFATLNHFAADLGIPSESDLLRIGISPYWEHDGWRGPARAKRDMVSFSTRTKRNVGRTGEILIWLVLILLVLGPWIAWFIGDPIDATLFAKATYALRASDGPTLSRSSLPLIYPASLRDVIKMESAFVAAHESAYGTKLTYRSIYPFVRFREQSGHKALLSQLHVLRYRPNTS